MTLPTWPAGLNYRSERRYWGGVPSRDPLATDFERGRTRQRPRPGDDVGTYSWGTVFTAAELTQFRTFWQSLGNGAGRFTMMVSLDGATHVERIVMIKAGSLREGPGGGPRTLVQFTLLVFPEDAA